MRDQRNIMSAVIFFCLIALSCEDQGMDEKPVSLWQPAPALVNSLSANGSYTFDGTEGDPITLETANRWIGKFHEANPEGTQGHFFGFEILQEILAQQGCKGIRIYYGIDDTGNRQLMLVGATEDGSNLLPTNTARSMEGGGGIIGDASYPCPTYCNPPGGSL